jgi:predicted phosphodiesterase
LLVHSIDKDLTDDDLSKSDIILHGHTHKDELRLEDGKFFMNPGHLKGPMEKNTPASFGIISIADRDVTATIYDMSFKIIKSIELVRSESGLYKA